MVRDVIGRGGTHHCRHRAALAAGRTVAVLGQQIEAAHETAPRNIAGVQQIADYLQTHHFQNLDSVSIVAHGAADELELGNAVLNAGNIGAYQTQLSQIGAAMQPGGELQLYGCDVAQAGTSDPFLNELAAATGVANIAASSHLVGAAAEGGSWSLDVDPIELF